MILKKAGDHEVMISGDRRQIEGLHAGQGPVAKRKPSHQIAQAVDACRSYSPEMLNDGFKGKGVAVNIAEKIGFHDNPFESDGGNELDIKRIIIDRLI